MIIFAQMGARSGESTSTLGLLTEQCPSGEADDTRHCALGLLETTSKKTGLRKPTDLPTAVARDGVSGAPEGSRTLQLTLLELSKMQK